MSNVRADLIAGLQRLARGYTDAAETVADILLNTTIDELMPQNVPEVDEVLDPKQVYEAKS